MPELKFTETSRADNQKPEYPYVAMRIPRGRAIRGSRADGTLQEGIVEGEVCYVPVNLKDGRAAKAHVKYLHDEKRYGYVEHDLGPEASEAQRKAFADLVSGWRDLDGAAKTASKSAGKG